MNIDPNLPLESPSPAELARQSRFWTWYVRGHLCLNVLWALAMLGVFDHDAAFADRLLDRFVEASMNVILLTPFLCMVLVVRALRHRRDFIKLAVVDAFLTVTGVWIILPAVQ